MLLVEPNTPPWWKRALLNMDQAYKPATPQVPERLYVVDAIADLPAANRWTDCIALARDTGIVWSDGTNWVAV